MRNEQIEVKVDKIHPISLTDKKEQPKMVVDGVQRSLNNLDFIHYAFLMVVEISDGERPLQWSMYPWLQSKIVRTLDWSWELENFKVHENSERNKNIDADFLKRYFDRDPYEIDTWHLKSEIKKKLCEKIDEALSNCVKSIVEKERALVGK